MTPEQHTARITEELLAAVAKLGGNADDLSSIVGGYRDPLDNQQKAKMAAEVNDVLRKLGAKSDLLGIVGSYGDTLDDADVLHALRIWNEARERENPASPG